jgi:hypothetical protein
MRLRQENQGAALIVAIAVLTILLAIALTFFTVTRLELRTATNVENTVRAELLADAATSIAISFLNADLIQHPSYTCLDHAWRTYFNGAWVEGKAWAFPRQTPDPGVPNEWISGWIPNLRDLNPLPDVSYTALDGFPGGGGIGNLYVPRKEPPAAPVDLMNTTYDPNRNPFVIDTAAERLEPGSMVGQTSGKTPAEQVEAWADVDNDGDGFRDSMWLPLVADTFSGEVRDQMTGETLVPGDGVDNDLDGVVDQDGEMAVFLYYGGSDGLDNDNNGIVDDPPGGPALSDYPGEDRWYLTAPITAPILAADGTYVVLHNVMIPGAPGPISINSDPTLPWPARRSELYDGQHRWVDSIDNDYDLVRNKHEDFYTDRTRPNYADPRNMVVERSRSGQGVCLTKDAFEALKGAHEISPNYLTVSMANIWRILSTAEPVCQIVGRMAVLITDEAGKVNVNATGGRAIDLGRVESLQTRPDVTTIAQTAADYWHLATSSGVAPFEYSTMVLPMMGAARSAKLWHLLMGAPNGSLALGPLATDLEALNAPLIEPEYVLDAVTPGYGLVDDNGNALLLAMNGLDDNGNGLVDEGVNDGTHLTPDQVFAAVNVARDNKWLLDAITRNPDPGVRPEYQIAFSWYDFRIPPVLTGVFDANKPETREAARRVYENYLGRFEGIDEPAEFQRRRPYRDLVAEGKIRRSDGITETQSVDGTPVVAAIGALGDHVIRTREELKRAFWNEPFGRTNSEQFMRLAKNLVTLHSTDKNNRFVETDVNAQAYESLSKKPHGLRLDYNYATAEEIAQALKEDWGMHSLVENYDVTSEMLAYATGLQMEGVTAIDSPITFVPPVPLTADPYLRALQIGANIHDSRDPDFARTEVTMTVDGARRMAGGSLQHVGDPWWFDKQVQAYMAPPPQGISLPLEEAESIAERRPIKYTVAGFEGIRITEMMVRPVRRVEAEMSIVENTFPPGILGRDPMEVLSDNPALSDYLYYDPNILAQFWNVSNPTVGKRDFYMKRRTIQDAVDGYADPNRRWSLGTIPRVNEVPRPIPDVAQPPANGRYWYRDSVLSPPLFPEGYLGPNSAMSAVFLEYPVLPADPPNPLDPRNGKIPVEVSDAARLLTTPEHWPNVVQFQFGPGPGLAPGRYYLTVNTTGVDGKPTVSPDNKIHYRIRNAPGPNPFTPLVPPPDILQDLLAARCPQPPSAGQPGTDVFSVTQNWPLGIIGPENVNKPLDAATNPPSGWVFLPGDPNQGFTVTIPGYTEDIRDQEYLYVAICMDKDTVDPQTRLSINFFDFSQEPDHEWVEIENVTGQDVDISGWELAVGGVDYKGDVVTEDQVFLTVPNGTIIPSTSPDNRLILGVNAKDYLASAGPPRIPLLGEPVFGLLSSNGIGLVGADLGGGADPNLDFRDVSVPMIPMRDPTDVSLDPRGGVIQPSVFEDPVLAQTRIVQLLPALGSGLDNLDVTDPGTTALSKTKIGYWVLRGGIFPNYPEHDGIDNDGDNSILDRDGVDNNGNAKILPIEPEGPYNIDEANEGIDEGRYRMDIPGGWKFVPDPYNLPNGVIPIYVAVPGAFSAWPVRYCAAFFGYDPFSNLDTDPQGLALLPAYLGGEAVFPPDWKDFIERRFFPGDNEVVSLFQGGHADKRVVDRVTYNERDVVNRVIDDRRDVRDVYGAGVLYGDAPLRPTLWNPAGNLYMGFWPDNTMGLDFYRTLERKYSAFYNGDRFGTSNRWEPTDGNYDDWSHNFVDYEPGENQSYPPALFNGSPLLRNGAELDLSGPGADRLYQNLYQNPVPPATFDALDADGDGSLTSQERETFLKWYEGAHTAAVGNQPFVSAGDALQLPYFSMTRTFTVNPATGAYDFPANDRVDGLRVGQSHPEDVKAVIGAGASDPVLLTVGQAEFYLLYPTAAQYPNVSDWTPLVGWTQPASVTEPWQPPQVWTPVCLYALGPGDPYPYAQHVPGLLDPTNVLDLGSNLFLFNRPALPAPWDADGALLSRWPIQRRAMMYVSGNLDAFYQDTAVRTPPTSFDSPATEALFVWNADAGVEDGQYDLYIDTGRDWDRMQSADRTSLDRLGNSDCAPAGDVGLLTSLGRGLVGLTKPSTCPPPTEVAGLFDQTPQDQLVFDIEAFTDRRNEGKCWRGALPSRTGLVRDAGPELEPNPNAKPSDLSTWTRLKLGDSFGMIEGLTPDLQGYVHYGIVRVENNFLAVFVRNWARAGKPNRILGVVLAPRDRSAGRINVNTVETRAYKDIATNPDSWRAFNALTGIPGVLLSQGTVFDPNTATPFRLGDATGDYVSRPRPLPGLTYQPNPRDPVWDLLRRARMIECGRIGTLHSSVPPGRERWDGRYYASLSELVSDDAQFTAQWDGSTGGTTLYPLSATNANLPRFNEIEWRFSRAANLITTRSDVFEILVTVQAGYGIDANGDGRINWRSNDEFIVTAEKKARTVYER